MARAFDPSAGFVDIPPFWAGSLAIALIAGAYATESFRGAFLGVDQGQLDAARALGLRPWAVLFFVRLPQAWRIALPSFGNHLVSLMKDTALVSVIGLDEIMFTAKMATSVTQAPFTMFAVVAVIYLAFTSALSTGLRLLEQRANRHLVR
ncbi:MAG: ABC transporter permease subunit [Pseudomonadota bacterium]